MSQTTTYVILGAASIAFSKLLLTLFNDPEGPNLLIVMVTAAVIYVASFIFYKFISRVDSPRRFILTILVQVIIVACLYFIFR